MLFATGHLKDRGHLLAFSRKTAGACPAGQSGDPPSEVSVADSEGEAEDVNGELDEEWLMLHEEEQVEDQDEAGNDPHGHGDEEVLDDAIRRDDSRPGEHSQGRASGAEGGDGTWAKGCVWIDVVADQGDSEVAEQGGDEEEGEHFDAAKHLFEFVANDPDDQEGEGEMPGVVSDEGSGEEPVPLPFLDHGRGIEAEILIEGGGRILGEDGREVDQDDGNDNAPADPCRADELEVRGAFVPEVIAILVAHS